MRGAQLAPDVRIAHDVDRREARRFAFDEHLRDRERHAGVHVPFDVGAEREQRGGVGPECVELFLGERVVDLRQHPVRRALEEVDLARGLHDLGNELHRARRAPDHRDPVAGEVVLPVPLRRMPHGARERVEPVDRGPDQVVEHPDCTHDDLGFDRGARIEREQPGGGAVVPLRARDAVAETAVRPQPVLVGDALHVSKDLGLGAVRLRPVGLELEREGVQRRRHVALASRIAVAVPGTPDVVGAFEQHEIVVPLVEEPFARAQASGPGADDRDTQFP